MTLNSNTDSNQPELNTAPLVEVSEFQNGIQLMTMDLPNSGANILNDEMFAALDQAITPLMHRQDIKGLILYSAKPRIFVAGANLNKIVATLDWPDKQIIEFCDAGRAVMRKFAECNFPTVAAIHGACVGGGLELALWCDGRVVTDERPSVLGLPEVKLGLVPGWAGTVRLPRISGLDYGLDLVTSGRLVRGNEAMEHGFIDRVTAGDDLLSHASGLIQELTDNDEYKRRRENVLAPTTVDPDEEALAVKWANRISENSTIWPLAPTVAMEHMIRAASLDHESACDSESRAMAEVYGSPASYGLLNNFFLGEHNKKKPGHVDLGVDSKPIDTVGVIGAGVMGKLIAANNLKRRKSVVLMDANRELAINVAKQLQSLGTITAVDSFQDFNQCDLVIESIIENVDIKRTLLRELESQVLDTTLIATNTSAIALSKLSDALKNPERFCGIHFCHPDLMSLVEVVKGTDSTKETVATAVQYVRSLGKMPLAVLDHAGFVVNRLLAAMLDQALRMVGLGHDYRRVDEAMREFGFQGGPFEIVDVIGADTCYFAGRQMYDAGVEAISTNPILPRMVKLKRLGRKTLKGFYNYDAADSSAEYAPEALEIIEKYVTVEPQTHSEPDKTANLICAAMAREASNILRDQIVADPRDIDLAIINGFSFPAHEGGILFWADRFGIANVNRLLEQIATTEPRMTPTQMMQEMEQAQGSFYPE